MSERRLFGQPKPFRFSCGDEALFRKPYPMDQDEVFCERCDTYRTVVNGKRTKRRDISPSKRRPRTDLDKQTTTKTPKKSA